MGNSGSKVCPQTEQLYKQCMKQFWNESFVASDNPNVCRDEFEDWKLCYQDTIHREVVELRAEELLEARRKELELEIANSPALGDVAMRKLQEQQRAQQDPDKAQ